MIGIFKALVKIYIYISNETQGGNFNEMPSLAVLHLYFGCLLASDGRRAQFLGPLYDNHPFGVDNTMETVFYFMQSNVTNTRVGAGLTKRIVSQIAACTDPKHHGLAHKIDRQL